MGIIKGTVFNPGVAQATGQGGASGDALLKSQNGADIPDTSRFRHNIGVDGMTLSGPRIVYPGVTHEFNLTGWSDFSIYQVSADAGTVDVKDGMIALHVPVDATGNVTLTVTRNDAHYSFTLAVSPVFILPPQITSPADGATDIDFTPVLTVSGFACNQEGVDTYLKTQWEISAGPGYYTDEERATAVFEGHTVQDYNVVALRDSAEARLDFAIPLSFGLEGEFLNNMAKLMGIDYIPAETRDYLVRRGATYRVRARHVGHVLISGWSEFVTFTISDHPIAKPVITYPAAGETDVDASPVLTASDFSLQHNAQDEFSTSEWEIATDPAFAHVVWKGSESRSTASPQGNTLSRSSTYYLRMRYKGKVTGYSDYSDTVSFTTAAHFLPTKEIATLLQPDGTKGAHFDTPVFSHDGTWLFIGASGAYTGAGITVSSGAVYAYKRGGQTWKMTQVITPPNPTSYMYFGTSLYFSGDSLFVTDNYNVYECTLQGEQWSVPAPIIAGISTSSGCCVSPDGNTVAIQYYDWVSYSVKIFTRNGDTWTSTKLNSPDNNLTFGAGISISAGADGTVLAVGASGDSVRKSAVYIYRLSEGTWNLEKTFQRPVNDGPSDFSQKIALSSDADMLFIAENVIRVRHSIYTLYAEAGEWKESAPLSPSFTPGDIDIKYSGGMLICAANRTDGNSDGGYKMIADAGFYSSDRDNGRLILKASITVTRQVGTNYGSAPRAAALSDDKSTLALGIFDDTQGTSSNAVVIFTEGGAAE